MGLLDVPGRQMAHIQWAKLYSEYRQRRRSPRARIHKVTMNHTQDTQWYVRDELRVYSACVLLTWASLLCKSMMMVLLL